MADLSKIQAVRQSVGGLDLQKPADLATYKDVRRKLLIGGEGCTHKAAPDIHGHLTVGYGFNMDRKDAATEFKKAFLHLKNPPDFNRVLARKDTLSDAQINQLFDHSLEMREGELQNHYGKDAWKQINPALRLGLEDIYYNTPSIIVKGTAFHKHLLEYHNTKAPECLNDAMACVCKNAEGQEPGVINRRHAQAGLLNVLDNPAYDNFQELHSKTAAAKKAQTGAAAANDGKEVKPLAQHKEPAHEKPKAHNVTSSKTKPTHTPHSKSKPKVGAKPDTHKAAKKKTVAEVDIGDAGESLASSGVVHALPVVASSAAHDNMYEAAANAARQMQGLLLNSDAAANIPHSRDNTPGGRTV